MIESAYSASSASSYPRAEARAATRWLLLPVCALFACLVLRSAWVTEDAFITLRTVDNFVHGYGLRWNTIERVQAYTHPLWMFLLSLLYFVTREPFYTTVVLGFSCSLLAILLLSKTARSPAHGAIAILMLCASSAFLDFSTSGLENPLTHLLVVAFFAAFARDASLLTLAGLAALIACNRMDAALSVAPTLLYASYASLRAHGLRRTARELALGFSPLIAWTAFALFYYGVPFPNTAYAKLNTGIPKSEVVRQGMIYLLASLGEDPALWLGIAIALAFALHARERLQWLLLLGIVLQLAYVVRVGGDFMQGRFLTLPLLLAALAIARSPLELERPAATWAIAPCFLAIFLLPRAKEPWTKAPNDPGNGVIDERAHYQRSSSLSAARHWRRLPSHPWSSRGRAMRANKTPVLRATTIGMLGFNAGPAVYIIDRLALSDPLLARLPAARNRRWRIGHFARVIPDGYGESVLGDVCHMEDQKLCAYWQKLKLITRGPLLSGARLAAIFELNTGSLEHLIDRTKYSLPGLEHRRLEELPPLVADGLPANQEPAELIAGSGVEIHLAAPSRAERMSISLDGDEDYMLELRQGGQLRASLTIESAESDGMLAREVVVPNAAREQGFDSVRVLPLDVEGEAGLGHLKLMP